MTVSKRNLRKLPYLLLEITYFNVLFWGGSSVEDLFLFLVSLPKWYVRDINFAKK